jgi:hypothetical protein
MAGEDANVEIALARSLVERMDEGDARRLWNKVVNLQDSGFKEERVRIEPAVTLPFPKRPRHQPLRRAAGMLF